MTIKHTKTRQGTWYFVDLAKYGFPVITRHCAFNGPNGTVVGVFVPRVNSHAPVVVDNYVISGHVDRKFRPAAGKRSNIRPIRVNRPFRFYPVRASADEANAVEWLDPHVDIETQLAISDDAQGKHYIEGDDFSQNLGVPDPTTIPLGSRDRWAKYPQRNRQVGDLQHLFKDFRPFNGEVIRPQPGGTPTETVVDVKPPNIKFDLAPGEHPEFGPWDNQLIKIRPERQTVRVPYTEEYSPIEQNIDDPRAPMKFKDGSNRMIQVPMDFPFRYWSRPLPGQRVPEHMRSKAGIANKQRTEQADRVPLPQPQQDDNARANYPQPVVSRKGNKLGHIFIIHFPLYKTVANGGSMEVNGKIRTFQEQNTMVRFKPIKRWLPDSPVYRTYDIQGPKIGVGEAHFRLDPVRGEPDYAWRPIDFPDDLFCRWYPEYLPENEESCRQQGFETYTRASPSNPCHGVWMSSEGRLSKAVREPKDPHDREAIRELNRKRYEKKQGILVKDYTKYANMKSMLRNMNNETNIVSAIHSRSRDLPKLRLRSLIPPPAPIHNAEIPPMPQLSTPPFITRRNIPRRLPFRVEPSPLSLSPPSLRDSPSPPRSPEPETQFVLEDSEPDTRVIQEDSETEWSSTDSEGESEMGAVGGAPRRQRRTRKRHDSTRGGR